MATFHGFEIDRAGVAEFLHSPELAAAVRALAEQVAAAARAQGHLVTSGKPLPVEVVDDPNQDRAGATVAVRHPAGIGMEAHHGVLKRAAESVGLHVEGLDP
ncbi:hypothetical protein [Actinokineospora terrae]|uniref:Uncharacterized protein n=1 Tax=Actinokineospora terrae TaxID=155974 RepID=A0A1H9XSE1_9PSEU|nr:hypothetical protein [Actinokineospora terrae]SES49070.1 hypothetical protein SAMN04487818_12413 [Actinokineospora terrae]